MLKLNAKQLRDSNPTQSQLKAIKRNPIYFVLDRIIDTYNIGSLFRLADAVACKKVYLCGKMETPPQSRIHKAAVGTENWVPWGIMPSTLDAVKLLNKKNVQSIAIEQHPKSISYKSLNKKLKFPVALIIGHEMRGIEKEVLEKVDLIVELPMFGINKSFNTWGAASVVAYKVLENL
ncbi:TrmH family RNA methyltransferase [Patescibacteria group bacterium]